MRGGYGFVVGWLVVWILAGLLILFALSCARPAAPAPAPVVQVETDSMPALAILYRGEVYTVTDIQLAPDGRTFLAQFRTSKTKGARK